MHTKDTSIPAKSLPYISRIHWKTPGSQLSSTLPGVANQSFQLPTKHHSTVISCRLDQNNYYAHGRCGSSFHPTSPSEQMWRKGMAEVNQSNTDYNLRKFNSWVKRIITCTEVRESRAVHSFLPQFILHDPEEITWLSGVSFAYSASHKPQLTLGWLEESTLTTDLPSTYISVIQHPFCQRPSFYSSLISSITTAFRIRFKTKTWLNINVIEK